MTLAAVLALGSGSSGSSSSSDNEDKPVPCHRDHSDVDSHDSASDVDAGDEKREELPADGEEDVEFEGMDVNEWAGVSSPASDCLQSSEPGVQAGQRGGLLPSQQRESCSEPGTSGASTGQSRPPRSMSDPTQGPLVAERHSAMPLSTEQVMRSIKIAYSLSLSFMHVLIQDC